MTTFEVWAPAHGRVRLRTGGSDHEMASIGDGMWSVTVPDAGPGSDYAFVLGDDETPLPDPRSRWQPHGVHGPSRVYDALAYEWGDGDWHGRQLAGSVLYELHVGTFTPEGTFDAAIGKLDHLARLGVDLVELMPVNAVSGDRNWGYDGVGWYAVHEPYGGPDGLKRFVDASHRRGLGVVLDVVYNHLGPAGAYQPRFGPYLKAGRSAWGDLINVDGPGSTGVRRYALDNALMWLDEFHLDGLRLDAVHALVDLGATHLLEELAVEVDALSAHLRRPLSLIAESDQNDPQLVRSRDAGGYGLTAQWDDDVHHAVQALLTGEREGYYADFGSTATLAKALTGGFVHDGTWSSFRGRMPGGPRPGPGVPVRRVPAEPRPGRQPRPRRPDLQRRLTTTSQGRCRAGPHLAVHADALDGRGVGRLHAVAVLHLLPGAGARRRRRQWPQGGVRHARLDDQGGAGPPGP
jgi:maltooligosyltrehalose trehalohydrolase